MVVEPVQFGAVVQVVCLLQLDQLRRNAGLAQFEQSIQKGDMAFGQTLFGD